MNASAFMLGKLRAGILALCVLNAPIRAEVPVYRASFEASRDEWIVEQMPGGSVHIGNGMLEIDDAAGCTVWLKQNLRAPLVINYEATVVVADGPHDRLSDLNCFWMASEPRSRGNLFFEGHGRTGAFATYDHLETYYVGYGGNENTTTRFRRYDGRGARSLLPEHDRRNPENLLVPNRVYQIRLTALADGTVEFYRDNERVFQFKDPAPLKEGWFGIRTVHSHLRIRNLTITQSDK